MASGDGAAGLYRLGWRTNGDNLDVALAVNRALAAGGRAWRLRAATAAADAGDYIAELTPARRAAVAALGVRLQDGAASLVDNAEHLTAAGTLLFAGKASAYPYYAYYALSLLRLGIAYAPCDGASLAQGALDDANLLVLPGGFSTFGIDAAEDATGADAAVRDFLVEGGTAIGSCGGAYYLSSGRPGWTGTANALPHYTHEWLQSGVGVVSLELSPGPLAFGCPPTIDVPYYHGPIYGPLGAGIEVAARFHGLSLPGRLSIDNPLDVETFRRDMQGKPAILLAAGNRGRAVLFSPHPEMGDLIRKYIALDGYVRQYLPIRGFAVMSETLRHYRVCDSPSFRLIQNAVDTLMTAARPAPTRHAASDHHGGDSGAGDIMALCRREIATLPDFGPGDEGDLMRDIARRIEARIAPASARLQQVLGRAARSGGLLPSLQHLVATMTPHFAGAAARPPAQRLMELELAVALTETWSRLAEFDLAMAGHA